MDDFQPRAQLKKQFPKGDLSSSHPTEIKIFSKKYIVPENLVRNYLAHPEHLELLKQKREREEKARKEARKEKTFEDYSWSELCKQRKLSTLRVMALDRYITHYNLSAMSKKMKKKGQSKCDRSSHCHENLP